MTVLGLSRHLRLLGALGILAAGAASASAQYHPGFRGGPFFQGYVGPVYGFAPFHTYGPYRPGPRFLHPAQVTRLLEHDGFSRVEVLHRQGDVFVVNAVSPRTGATRLIVDAQDGEIIERFAMRSAPQRHGTPNAVAPRRPETLRPPAIRPPIAAPDAGITNGNAPLPPRRPTAAATPAPTPQVITPAPAASQPVSRRPSDWAPINSVPPAALE